MRNYSLLFALAFLWELRIPLTMLTGLAAFLYALDLVSASSNYGSPCPFGQ